MLLITPSRKGNEEARGLPLVSSIEPEITLRSTLEGAAAGRRGRNAAVELAWSGSRVRFF